MAFVRQADVVIVGAGVMGAATARALAPSGRDIVLVEQFSPGNHRGSSHGRSRIFRLSYPDVTYVQMAQKALRLWRKLEEQSGERLLSTSGGIDLGDGIEANAAALEECGVPFEMMGGREAARRIHSVSFRSTDDVLFQPDAGIVFADRAISAMLSIAGGRGVELRQSERVLSLDVADDSVMVRTEHAVFKAATVVVTAGGWAAPLLATAGITLDVRVTRETVSYFEVLGDTPPPIVEWGSPAIYALASPGQGVKAAQHVAGPEIDPDSEAKLSTHSAELVSAWVQQRLPNANPTPHHMETCLYTNTADEGFVLERHGPIVVGSACSGHGFKFAPLIGEQLANLAEGLTV